MNEYCTTILFWTYSEQYTALPILNAHFILQRYLGTRDLYCVGEELVVKLLLEDEFHSVEDVVGAVGGLLVAVLHGEEVTRRMVQAHRNPASPGKNT